MEPVHFNCKSASRQRNRKRCAPPLICSPGVLGSLSIHLHYFHHFFLLQSISYETISSCLLAQLVAHGMLFWECVYDCKVFSNAFYFLFQSGCDDSPRCTFVFLLTQYFLSRWSHLPSVFLLHFPLRLLARTCVHHRHILVTCYLITRARPTLRTSLAEQTRAKHQKCVLCNQSQPYNKNCPTRGVWRTDTKSNRGTFYIENGVKQIKYDKCGERTFTRDRRRGNPKYKNILLIFQRTFHAAL